jgi:SLOG in TRPM, prokaryote
MENMFMLATRNGTQVKAVSVDEPAHLPAMLGTLGLYCARSVIVLVGGANLFSAPDQERLRPLFIDVLVPLAESLQAAVIDGGTDTGVMHLIGQARAKLHATFPLIGVIPDGKVQLPERPLPGEIVYPEPHHTHFILVPGSQWGDEARWMTRLADVLAQGAPSVTLLMNGGDVAWQDVSESVESKRLVIVIDGSGRTADILADAVHGQTTHTLARTLVNSGLLRVIDLSLSVDAMTREFTAILKPEDVQHTNA